MVRYGTVRYGTVQYGTIQSSPVISFHRTGHYHVLYVVVVFTRFYFTCDKMALGRGKNILASPCFLMLCM